MVGKNEVVGSTYVCIYSHKWGSGLCTYVVVIEAWSD